MYDANKSSRNGQRSGNGYGDKSSSGAPRTSGYGDSSSRGGYGNRGGDRDNRSGGSSYAGGRGNGYGSGSRDSSRGGYGERSFDRAPRNGVYGDNSGSSAPRTSSYSENSSNFAPRPTVYAQSPVSSAPRTSGYGDSSSRGSYGNSSQSSGNGYGGRSSYGNSSRGNGSRFSSSRGGFGGGNSGRGGGRRGFKGETFNDSQFIKKAQEFVKIEEREVLNNFSDFAMKPELLANILAKGYVKPTPIQDETIAAALAGRDVLGIAATGSGKTAAFVLPIINKILENPKTRAMILAPTRELAQQIKQEIRSFTPGLKVFIALAIGGSFLREQIMDIKRGPNIIVGTPGRIKDLAQRRVINFAGLDTIVLDEVDRMLDMGFIDDIRAIMEQIPEDRQTLFFSATTNPRIDGLINTFLKDPMRISLKTKEPSTHVEQNIVKVKRHEKEDTLCNLLSQEEFTKVLVFGGTKMIVEKISQTLIQRGFKAGSIHGDKRQNERQRVLRAFTDNHIKILVATDVAARGLDIADITHVINYDKPNSYTDYIHRIGRTGRGDKKGFALTFVDQVGY